MDESRESGAPEDAAWVRNYFNYFTEIEEHFQRARGTGLFLLSPLDWALIENWKMAGIPVEAVLKGIDEAFEKWRSRKSKGRLVNSLAYCAQAVLEAAQRLSSAKPAQAGAGAAPFTVEEIGAHLGRAALSLRAAQKPALEELASSVEALASDSERYLQNLEQLERRLAVLEEKIVAVLRAGASADELLSIRETLDGELRPYRRKMTADQLAMLERRYLDAALLKRAKLERLSLFYLR